MGGLVKKKVIERVRDSERVKGERELSDLGGWGWEGEVSREL